MTKLANNPTVILRVLCGIIVLLLLGGCSTPLFDVDPLQDYLDDQSIRSTSRYYRDRGYDRDSARRRAEEEWMLKSFESK